MLNLGMITEGCCYDKCLCHQWQQVGIKLTVGFIAVFYANFAMEIASQP